MISIKAVTPSSLWHGIRLAVQTLKRLLVSLAQDFMQADCQKSAAALTYATLFALVPTLTVVYWLFSFFPTFDGASQQMQQLILDNFVPEAGSDILTYVSGFSEKARSLGGAGAGLLLITAYLMLRNIEQTFNRIWGVVRARRGLTSFLLYWAVLTIGPMLLLAGLVMNTYLLSLRLVFNEYDVLGVSSLFFQILPWVLATGAFTLLFVAVPNCRVPLKYGVIGGLVTALCFELLKRSFGWLVANSSFQSVYGAFAALPLFLIWVNCVWMVVLSGALLVRTLAERRYLTKADRQADMHAALLCLGFFRERAQVGNCVSDYDCYRLGINVVHWQALRASLIRNHWIVETASGKYALRRDLNTVTLWDLAKVTNLSLSDLGGSVKTKSAVPWLSEYEAKQAHLLAEAKSTLDLPLERLFSAISKDKLREKEEPDD